MLNVLIVCKENETAKKIVNKLVVTNEKLKIIGIGNTLAEAETLVKNIQPDLIITTNKNIMNLVKRKFIAHQPGVVLISKDVKSSNTSGGLLTLGYTLSFNEMSKKISIFIRKNLLLSQKEEVMDILSKFGFDFKLSGSVYLLESIVYARTYKGTYSFEQLAKDIYSHVAENNNTTVDRVKWSIERSIKYMYKRHTKASYEYVEKYFNIKYPEKLTPKLVINFVTNNLE